MNLFINYLTVRPQFYFCWVGSLVVSITLHEFSHAFMAREFGDETAASEGHLTLNPIKQMGLYSLACLFLFGICWGAVPVNRNKVSRAGQSVISAAGPFANLLIAFCCAMLLRFFPKHLLLNVALQANCLLFIFNMLPLPILDGWGILEPFIPPMKRLSQEMRNNISGWVIFILWVTPASRILAFLSSGLASMILPKS